MTRFPLCLLVGLLASLQTHAATYSIERSLPCAVGCIGNITVSGLISTPDAGRFELGGSVSLEGVTISADTGTYDTSGYQAYVNSPILIATATELTFVFSQSRNSLLFDNAGGGAGGGWGVRFMDGVLTEFAGASRSFVALDPFDFSGSKILGSTNMFVLTITPLPPSMVVLSSGLVGLVLIVRRSRRRTLV